MSTLVEKMRAALRIKSENKFITEEIEDVIEACKEDLRQSGVVNIDEQDKLIIRAITLYTKSEFGYQEKSEQFMNSYENLRIKLSLSGKYNKISEGGEDGTMG